MPSSYTRRSLLAGLAASSVAATAGCLDGEEPIARCSSRGRFTEGPLVAASPLDGTEQVSLGILVQDGTAADKDAAAAVVRNRDGDLVADVPLDDNRMMSRLDPADHPKFDDGELYAVPLGPPPQHAALSVEIVDADGTVRDEGSVRFNCYDYDGDLP